ncbi:hypothetical protein Bca4012_083932 [Brassica carinata]
MHGRKSGHASHFKTSMASFSKCMNVQTLITKFSSLAGQDSPSGSLHTWAPSLLLANENPPLVSPHHSSAANGRSPRHLWSPFSCHVTNFYKYSWSVFE